MIIIILYSYIYCLLHCLSSSLAYLQYNFHTRFDDINHNALIKQHKCLYVIDLFSK